MKNINVLILSAGRRVELIDCFKEAAKKENIKSKIVAADISNLAPAIYFADKYYLVPKIGESGYINNIIDICKKEKIKLIVPTIDTELLILSKNKEKIESETDAKLLVSNYDVITICRDKINTQRFFEQNNLGVPRLITKEEIESNKIKYPVFVKPVDGSSSINTFKAKNLEELIFFSKYVSKAMVQEFVTGTEYTVDVFCDFDSNPITIVPRQRIATRSGEISKGKIVKDRKIIDNIKLLISKLKPIGQVTIQCMKDGNKINYIEINPRFGGGAPMSIKAGADSCENLYKLLKGEKLIYNEEYKEDVIFLRYDSSIMLGNEMEYVNDKSNNI